MVSTPVSAAKDVVQRAGENLIKHFGNVEITNNKSHNAADVVTRLDTETEKFIEEELAKFDSSIGFCGEEFGKRNDATKFWIVDPIDGTGHFVRGIPFCTTMIGLIDGGKVIASVIYNFVTKELFEAEIGKGAYLNGKKISVSSRALKDSYVSVESRLRNDNDIRIYKEIRNKSVPIHTISCGYEYGLVATGKIDGRICFDSYGGDYDYAPVSLLVSEAGGVVKNIGKNTYDYTNHDFLAVNPEIYRELTEGDGALFPINK